MEFFIYATGQNADHVVDLTQFGYAADEKVPVYDIWEKSSVGEAAGTLKVSVPSHGVKLFRLGDNKSNAIKTIEQQEQNKSGFSSEEQCYDLMGRKVQSISHGFYIKKGKKYLVR